MPSHPNHSALTQMYLVADGAPWTFKTWKEITGVVHGLFPPNDKHLPGGWNRETADDISSYFDQYRAILTEEKRIKFSSGKDTQMIPGRKAWRNFVVKVWKESKIHEKIHKVLTDQNLHPFTILSQTGDGIWPDADQWVPIAVDPVGLALFGEECYSGIFERVQPMLRNMTKALITRSWINLYTGLERSKKQYSKLEDKAVVAFKELDKDKLTKTKIKAVVVKVMAWKRVAEFLSETLGNLMDAEERIEEMEGELMRLMVGLDDKVKPGFNTKPKKSLCRVTTKALKALASEEDIADVVNLFNECFNPSASDTAQLTTQVPKITFDFAIDGADPGTEFEATIPPDLLSKNLGFQNKIPLLFNTYKHSGGITPWDNPELFQNQGDEALTPNELHWHQLSGVHGILRRLLSKTAGHARPSGILVADEVGLGKTLQSLAILAWLTECVARQVNSTTLPPILRENPYLGESKIIPNRCHLIIVPGTILRQWEATIKTFLRPKVFDLFIYTTGKAFRREFWAQSGPFNQSRQNHANRIILATHTALSQEYHLLFMSPKITSKTLPWQKPKRVVTYDSIVKNTLFGLEFLSVTLDEAHEFRNTGPKHSAALAILERSKIILAMSATPLQTATKDLSSVGRLIGIEFFFSQKAFDEEKADTAELRRAKASLGEDYDPFDSEQDEIAEVHSSVALRIQGQFERRILRRTTESKNWQGKQLIRLPKLHEHTVLLALEPFEQEIHSQLSDKLREELSSCSSMKVFSSDFYLRSRMGAIYPRLSLKDEIPTFDNLQDWQEHKSTKIDICARMCRHLLSRDDAPSMIFRNGGVIFPEVPKPSPGEKVSHNRKILIYQEFPSFGPLIRNVFNLYNIKHLYIDGQTSYDDRAKVIKIFNEDPSIRILFFSSVGASGLNLTVASVVIFLDQPWSAQDERQVLGRAYRQPQSKEVHCYHLLADETSDVVLSALARGKRDMLESFLGQAKGQEMLEMMTVGVPLCEDAPDCEDAPTKKKPKPKKTAVSTKSDSQPSKPMSVVIPDPSTSENIDSLVSVGPTAEGPKTPPLRTAEVGRRNSVISTSSSSLVPAPKTPPRKVEIGKRRDRSEFRSVHESPEAQRLRKYSRLELVGYSSSPEKAEQEDRQPSPESDWAMDYSVDDTLPNANDNDEQAPMSSITSSSQAEKFGYTSSSQPSVISTYTSSSQHSAFSTYSSSRQPYPSTSQRSAISTFPSSSQSSAISNYPSSSGDHSPIASGSRTEADTSTISIPKTKRSAETKTNIDLKAALRSKISMKPFTEAQQQNRANMKSFKLKVIQKQADVGQLGESPSSQTYDAPDIRQPTMLQKPRELTPPPRSTASQNPCGKIGMKKKSKWA